MYHIGLLCLPVPGHLNPMAALGRELQRRGHRVSYFGIPDSEAAMLAEGLEFREIGRRSFPPGSLPTLLRELGERRGLTALRYTMAAVHCSTRTLCQEAPQALRAAGVDALLVDATEPAGGTVAQYLGIPFVTIFNALVLLEEPAVPPVFTSWAPASSRVARLRNRAAYAVQAGLALPTGATLWRYRRRWRLPMARTIGNTFSGLAQISQLPAAFDFPRRSLPSGFHYTGPFRLDSSRHIPFPYERLSGRPLIYASMGTLHNRARRVFAAIAAACAGLDAQLVISLGGGGRAEDFGDLPGRPLVVSYAPQPEIIARAALTITHAGLNTVLEALSHGVPMVAIPIANDQPGVAARLRHSGAGLVVRGDRLAVGDLRATIEQALREESYRGNARRLQEAIRRSGGVRQAADIVERAIPQLDVR